MVEVTEREECESGNVARCELRQVCNVRAKCIGMGVVGVSDIAGFSDVSDISLSFTLVKTPIKYLGESISGVICVAEGELQGISIDRHGKSGHDCITAGEGRHGVSHPDQLMVTVNGYGWLVLTQLDPVSTT